MKIYPNSIDNPCSRMEVIKAWASLAASVVGILVMLVGLKYAVNIISFVFDVLKSPENIETAILHWQKVLNLSQTGLTVGGIDLSSIQVLVILGVGFIFVGWLAMGLMKTGAHIVSLTASDRDAVKKVLRYAFGEDVNTGPKE